MKQLAKNSDVYIQDSSSASAAGCWLIAKKVNVRLLLQQANGLKSFFFLTWTNETMNNSLLLDFGGPSIFCSSCCITFHLFPFCLPG